MKIAKLSTLLLSLFIVSCNSDDTNSQTTDTKALAQEKLDAALSKFPGLSLSVKSANESYTLVAGDAETDEQTMQASSLHYMQSISKTFTAVAVLKLKEEGRINLDAKINTYLPASVCNNLANGNIITVRQLLNMTSGLPDYIDNDQFFNDVLSGPLPMPSEQVLGYVYGKPANFTPGTSFGYSNINYHLLALIIDSVTDNGHRNYITTKVINAAGLANTYYIAGTTMAAPTGTTASYLADGSTFTDVSELQLGTVQSFIGDDGIVATTQDITAFYYKLLKEGTLLTPASLAEMKTTVSYQGQPIYGLGLHFYKTPEGVQAIGHDGSGAGAAAYAFYFPSKNMSVTLCTNTGTLIDANKEAQFMALWQEILNILL
ncbi:beta-lactamase family protein [Flavobacterium sp. MFBS3-15]|uniref:serine hydrolase domain-containing protein n=1 Tax=Flavobacterium sp. MFBS3-15 TaxID=2989816 RepID=UPI00223637E8|nr:serine hydrolase domain-containing protein [Flavobacterium sp. MFBS3-15]MCW4468065.1 beta-lactamase family protein [Flavobacterium sp. MFBS3-15]